MKKLGLFILMILCLGTVSCSNDDEPDLMQVREVAWNSIEEGEFGRESVVTPWQEAEVKTKEGNYAVTFYTEQDLLLGPIIVFVNGESLEVTGQAPRY
ncbi:hypothetical protein [Echinicola vietnamensis]|uniref:Uncharacterized protein n=1 Tax=Echinicola vietnamensis (strain DSM 17526 / LMG 23754 / KMM 6221) TaxID=926556 RepID=L0FWT3_ECHVK|nr:hypothetical protein [Echinicola vietnamensis]AGA77216.1 hypothetical protein Echvi_0943 [Echinicola vietnamensis DSM 17526]